MINTLFKPFTTFTAIILYFICSAVPATADIGYYHLTPSTSIPFPGNNDHVELNKVNVVITATDGWAGMRAVCEFEFKNTSNAVQETVMGFPVAFVGGENNLGIWSLNHFEVKLGLEKLETALTGEPVTFRSKENAFSHYRLVAGSSNKRFSTLPYGKDDIVRDGFSHKRLTTIYWKYVFAPLEKQRFVVEYQAATSQNIEYILSTADSWKGDVSVMTVTVQFPCKMPLHALEVTPPGFDYSADAVQWRFSNYKITDASSIEVKAPMGCLDYDSEKIPTDYFSARRIEDSDYRADRFYVQHEPRQSVSVRGEGPPHMIKSPELFIEEAAYLRNEIFARHGYCFSNPKYQACFSKQPWYKERPAFSEKDFNYIERRNVRFLKCVEDQIKKLPKNFAAYFERIGETTKVEGCATAGKTITYSHESGSYADEDGNPIRDPELERTHKVYKSLNNRFFELEEQYVNKVQECQMNNPY